MNRSINKVAVLGAGIMGTGIACHFANIGVKVLLLDLPTTDEPPADIPTDSQAYRDFRNQQVQQNLNKAIKIKPAPLYTNTFASRIEVGNFEDDIHQIKTCDWIIEVIIEKLEFKKALFEKIDQYRQAGTIVSSNTSGIPIHHLSEGRSDDFKQHFCGTHFFNPPRYLKLLEIIPDKNTCPEIVEFLSDYGQRFLGKTTVLAKDTPAFVANRIGVYSIITAFNLVEPHQLNFETLDKLTGQIIGRPKSATFRTADIVGLDTIMFVLNDLKENCSKDEMISQIPVPVFINRMLEKKYLGAKTKQGFYRKEKDKNGRSIIYSLNPQSVEYQVVQKVKMPELEMISAIDHPLERIKNLFFMPGKIGQIYQDLWLPVFSYASQRLPEISDQLFEIDEAIKAGFGWQYGIFEVWEYLGVKRVNQFIEQSGHKVAAWVNEMLSGGFTHFYSFQKGKKQSYSITSHAFHPVTKASQQLSFQALKAENTLWQNKGASIIDLGDGVLNLEFHTKMNVLGTEFFEGLHKALDLAEKEYKALILYNEGEHFSAGANVGLIFMLARDQEIDELDYTVRQFQKTVMRIRYSSVPVVAAIHGYTFGGGCEVAMHADKVIAHAETYMGLVELGVGLIPAGGGTKEFALRLSDQLGAEDIRSNAFRERFLTIGQAKVSTSAYEAFELGYLRKGVDELIVNRDMQLLYAKNVALQLSNKGYSKPILRQDIKVMGNEGLGLVWAGADSMRQGQFISEYDQFLAEKLGYILSGGNLSGITQVSEQYLLDLERETFVQLCMQTKTLERLQSLISTGKILRN